MSKLSAKFLDIINKLKTHDIWRDLSPMKNNKNFDKTRVNLFPNFIRYPLITILITQNKTRNGYRSLCRIYCGHIWWIQVVIYSSWNSDAACRNSSRHPVVPQEKRRTAFSRQTKTWTRWPSIMQDWYYEALKSSVKIHRKRHRHHSVYFYRSATAPLYYATLFNPEKYSL